MMMLMMMRCDEEGEQGRREESGTVMVDRYFGRHTFRFVK